MFAIFFEVHGLVGRKPLLLAYAAFGAVVYLVLIVCWGIADSNDKAAAAAAAAAAAGGELGESIQVSSGCVGLVFT